MSAAHSGLHTAAAANLEAGTSRAHAAAWDDPHIEPLVHRLRVELDHVQDDLSSPGDVAAVNDAAYALMTAQAMVRELIDRLGFGE